MALEHPKGLYVLFFTEIWERFGFYLMVSLLVFYLNEHHGMSEQAASGMYGNYLALMYLTPLLGGMLADRYLGYSRALIIGAVLLAAGYFVFAIDNKLALYLSMGLLILGNGLFKPNVSTLVGNLYPQGDSRRDSAFSIFYMGVNIGAGLAPVVGELVRGRYGFSWAFATAGVGMTFSLIIFSLFRHHLKVADTRSSVAAVLDIPLPADYEDPRDPPAVERQRITALIIMCAIVMVFWMAFHQNGSTLSLWARDNTNRVITLYDRHLQPYPFTIPPGWFAAVNSFFILTFTPVLVWLFRRLRAVRLEPSTPAKIGLGMLLTGASYILMVGGALAGGNHGKVSLWWLVGCYFVITIAELLLSPMGLSMVTKLAPRRMTAMMMGLWFISTSIGNKLAGELGKLWEKWPHSRFFALLVAASFFAALVLATQFRRLRAAMPPEGPAPDTRPSELSSSDSPEPSPAMDSAATALH